MSSSSSSVDDGIFNIAIATIFAREILEGALIIGNYRTCIRKTVTDEHRAKEQLRAVTVAALFAAIVAVLVIVAVAIPLGILSNELDATTVMIVEGVAKIVGAVAILQLSLKIPVWLDIYKKISLFPVKKLLFKWCNGSSNENKDEENKDEENKDEENKDEENKDEEVGLTIREIRFNVAWNIWREVAECGAFLIPFFLHGAVRAIPLSALVGTLISLILGILLYVANNKMNNKTSLAVFMSGLMLQLSVGLFTMGCNEFEKVWGMTRIVWQIDNPFWNDKSLPMTILRPFGYSSTRTVLQICCFWIWLLFGLFLHFLKWHYTSLTRTCEEEEQRTDVSDEPPPGSEGRPREEVGICRDEEAMTEENE